MVKQKFKTLGYEIEYNVPSTVDEYNKLDTKRTNACLEDAILNTAYRQMHVETRNLFLNGREAEEAKDGKPAVAEILGFEEQLGTLLDGVKVDPKNPPSRKRKPALDKDGKPRKDTDGEPITVPDETQQVFFNRGIALLVHHKKFAGEDAARKHFEGFIQKLALGVVCDPSAPEPSEKGPKKLRAIFKVAAARLIAMGTFANFNTKNLKPHLGKEFVPTKDITKMFTGEYPHVNKEGKEVQVPFNVSDKDAEALGWLIKEHQDWKNANELRQLGE
jgi:hypothetical protein